MIALNVSFKGFLSENIIRFKFQVTEKKMKKYEKEYLLQKEQEAQLEDPVERLTVSHRNNSSSLIVVFLSDLLLACCLTGRFSFFRCFSTA